MPKMSKHAYMCKRRTNLLNTSKCAHFFQWGSSKREMLTVYSVYFIHCSVESIWTNIFHISHPSIHWAHPFPAIPLLVPTCQSQSLITPQQSSVSMIYSPCLLYWSRTLPSMHAQHHTPTRLFSPALSMCCSLLAHCAALPPGPSHTLTQSPFCLLSTSMLQNLTVKTNPYPANKLKTKAVPQKAFYLMSIFAVALAIPHLLWAFLQMK